MTRGDELYDKGRTEGVKEVEGGNITGVEGKECKVVFFFFNDTATTEI